MSVPLKRRRPVGHPPALNPLRKNIGVRIDAAMEEALNRELQLERAAAPGSHIQQSDIARMLMAEGLQHRLLNRSRPRRK